MTLSSHTKVVPEMFYYQTKKGKTKFDKKAWEAIITHPNTFKCTTQSPEEIGAVGQGYFVNNYHFIDVKMKKRVKKNLKGFFKQIKASITELPF